MLDMTDLALLIVKDCGYCTAIELNHCIMREPSLRQTKRQASAAGKELYTTQLVLTHLTTPELR